MRRGRGAGAALLAGLEATCHRPGDGDLDQFEQDQRPDRDRRELQPEASAHVGHAAVVEVRLEQQRRARRRLGPGVHLEQLALGLVPVLRPRQIAHLGDLFAAREDHLLLGAERELLADQARFVGVDDRAVLAPDLDPHERTSQDVVPHDGVEPVECVSVHRDDIVIENRSDEPDAADVGDPPGFLDRLLGADASAGDGGEGDDEDERDESGDREAGHDLAHRDRLHQRSVVLHLDSLALTRRCTRC